MPTPESGSTELHASNLQSPRSNPQSRIHVVAGVLQDSRGRILLARREGQRELAGLWEFPGGKVEPGEHPVQALGRELHEEIGVEIDPDSATALMAVPHRMANGKRIVLDVYRIGRFNGRARGMEAQALAWVEPGRLPSYSMPDADRPVVAALTEPACYLITPEPGQGEAAQQDFLQRLEQALRAGITRLQLRARQLQAAEFRTCALRVAECMRRYEAEWLLNSASMGLEASIALAQELGAGLHLTSEHLRALQRRPLGEARCAASCHDLDELQQAQALGLDFAVLGPVRTTATHPQAQGLGFENFARLREAVSLPIYALGGLLVEDLALARAHGSQGIAAIRGLWPG